MWFKVSAIAYTSLTILVAVVWALTFYQSRRALRMRLRLTASQREAALPKQRTSQVQAYMGLSALELKLVGVFAMMTLAFCVAYSPVVLYMGLRLAYGHAYNTALLDAVWCVSFMALGASSTFNPTLMLLRSPELGFRRSAAGSAGSVNYGSSMKRGSRSSVI